MRLKHIRLSGFKSFVDQSLITFPGQSVGIVGPNGCGKSNVIDAVRWVMGGTAKNLRGASMDDVIFNGCATRKPVGKAAVELAFDNTDANFGGAFAQYNEIVIRREVTREGQSNYSINGTRCRRRDVVDIFLGTGLGPRSYAIISQGTVSSIIESKPEEMRVFLEEAAGISKYKERRRETANRMSHTEDNLDRLSDLRDELDKQLSHLQRQAKAAEQYQTLKAEERVLAAQAQALQWRQMEEASAESRKTLQQDELALEEQTARLRSLETQLTESQEALSEKNEAYHDVQSEFYKHGAEIARLEQDIQNREQRDRQLQEDFLDVCAQLDALNTQCTEDKALQETLMSEEAALAPKMAEETQRVEEATQVFQTLSAQAEALQTQWDTFFAEKTTHAQSLTQHQVQSEALTQSIEDKRAQLMDLEVSCQQLHPEELNASIQALSETEEQLVTQLQTEETAVEAARDTLTKARTAAQTQQTEWHAAQTELQTLRGRQASLEALQEEALGEDARMQTWLQQTFGEGVSHLADVLTIEPGWEKALEVALGPYLQTVCVKDFPLNEKTFQTPGSAGLLRKAATSFQASSEHLASKVQSDWPVGIWLQGVYCAETLDAAFKRFDTLSEGEAVVTREGVYLSKHYWYCLGTSENAEDSLLKRAQVLKELDKTIATQASLSGAHESSLNDALALVTTSEQTLEKAQVACQTTLAKKAEATAQLEQARATQTAQQQQLETKKASILQLKSSLEEQAARREALQQAHAAVLEHGASFEEKQSALMALREDKKAELIAQQSRLDSLRDALHAYQTQEKTLQTQLHARQESLSRTERQQAALTARKEDLERSQSELTTPVQALRDKLDGILEVRLEVEQKLMSVRSEVEVLEEALRTHQTQRHEWDATIQALQTKVSDARLQMSEVSVRQTTICEALEAGNQNLQTLLETLPEEATVAETEEALQRLEAKIKRLGAINLAALDEYEVQSKRKQYLDEQHEDLVQSLEMLQQAIHKIDKETRTRLRETYDEANRYFQQLFPKIFGGGRAYLALTSDDLLEAGVTLMAQPPGKRNSTIHLLSGGEKALTAVALIFALFQLNPAPFCMLDEVDAPLDDLNTARFANLVKEMSEHVQFIVISHNKITIEQMDQLIGVTMHEAGVSRKVSVDIQEAIALAEA